MELPLLARAQSGMDKTYRLTDEGGLAATESLAAAAASDRDLLVSLCGVGASVTLPTPPGPGEQYRFHFDMTRCIGCKCCVVACNEQNANPAEILWRRVGEIEGGVYPDTTRHHLSMGCNHCLEPSCMTGCPVNAYTKDPITGIVLHSADACIGCQYCTWNCSYGVPQYNPARGVVGKCDMCHSRLTQDQLPACVAACPEGAIQIETVRIDAWRRDYHAADSPGMPSADDSLSTTRITQAKRMAANTGRVDLGRLRPEHPHTPLICMTVLTQLAVGAFAAIWMLALVGSARHRAAAPLALMVTGIALAASTLHLGRPIHAWRALRMWRRSWLSREVLLFTLFVLVATLYSFALWLSLSAAFLLGAVTVLLGIAGVGTSARLYRVPGRPAWNSPFTYAHFFLTTALMGAISALLLDASSALARRIAISICLLIVAVELARLLWLMRSSVHELRGAATLLRTVLKTPFAGRLTLLLCTGVLLAHADAMPLLLLASALALAAEFAGRWLFFVSVVPTNIAAQYLAPEAA